MQDQPGMRVIGMKYAARHWKLFAGSYNEDRLADVLYIDSANS